MWINMKGQWHNKMAKFECGIVIEDKYLPGMVEGRNWEDIVTYERPPRPFGDGQRPFQLSDKGK